ncbi:hypothetical protein BD413DRAFT_611593 [Trametes elegans]|nr:hypothetical protein BD413DRAFT_611593 [Trametes elegans]
MQRPHINTARPRRPIDPSQWVVQDLADYVNSHYPRATRSSLVKLVETRHLTPQSLWLIEGEVDGASYLADGDVALQDQVLDLADRVRPVVSVVSPSSPRRPHARILAELLDVPPPPPPPPIEEPDDLEEEDTAPSIMSDWALDEADEAQAAQEAEAGPGAESEEGQEGSCGSSVNSPGQDSAEGREAADAMHNSLDLVAFEDEGEGEGGSDDPISHDEPEDTPQATEAISHEDYAGDDLSAQEHDEFGFTQHDDAVHGATWVSHISEAAELAESAGTLLPTPVEREELPHDELPEAQSGRAELPDREEQVPPAASPDDDDFAENLSDTHEPETVNTNNSPSEQIVGDDSKTPQPVPNANLSSDTTGDSSQPPATSTGTIDQQPYTSPPERIEAAAQSTTPSPAPPRATTPKPRTATQTTKPPISFARAAQSPSGAATMKRSSTLPAWGGASYGVGSASRQEGIRLSLSSSGPGPDTDSDTQSVWAAARPSAWGKSGLAASMRTRDQPADRKGRASEAVVSVQGEARAFEREVLPRTPEQDDAATGQSCDEKPAGEVPSEANHTTADTSQSETIDTSQTTTVVEDATLPISEMPTAGQSDDFADKHLSPAAETEAAGETDRLQSYPNPSFAESPSLVSRFNYFASTIAGLSLGKLASSSTGTTRAPSPMVLDTTDSREPSTPDPSTALAADNSSAPASLKDVQVQQSETSAEAAAPSAGENRADDALGAQLSTTETDETVAEVASADDDGPMSSQAVPPTTTTTTATGDIASPAVAPAKQDLPPQPAKPAAVAWGASVRSASPVATRTPPIPPAKGVEVEKEDDPVPAGLETAPRHTGDGAGQQGGETGSTSEQLSSAMSESCLVAPQVADSAMTPPVGDSIGAEQAGSDGDYEDVDEDADGGEAEQDQPEDMGDWAVIVNTKQQKGRKQGVQAQGSQQQQQQQQQAGVSSASRRENRQRGRGRTTSGDTSQGSQTPRTDMLGNALDDDSSFTPVKSKANKRRSGRG